MMHRFLILILAIFFLQFDRVALVAQQNDGMLPDAGNAKEADLDPSLHEMSLEDLLNVKVTTATRTKMSLRDVPVMMYVITEKQIKSRGYRTLSDALHDVPGFDFQHTYGIYPDLIHQRGLVGNNQHLLLYVDGVPDNNISENAILGGSIRFPLYNVKRIEIVSGPISSIYGANAFNGVINIITKESDGGTGGEVQLFGGTWMDSRYLGGGSSATLRGRLELGGEVMNYSISAYYLTAQGPDFRNTSRLDSSQSVGYYWSPWYNNSWEDTYNITASFIVGNFRFRTVNWQYLQGDGTFANGLYQIDTDRNQFTGSSWDFRNNSLSMGYLWDISHMFALDSELVFRHTQLLQSSHESYPNQSPPTPAVYGSPWDVTTASDYSREDFEYRLNERLNITVADNLLSTVGAELVYNDVPMGYGDFRRKKYYNYGFSTLVLYRPLDITSIAVSYRYDYNTSYGSSHTPSASIVLTPGDLTAKLIFSTGFRAPTAWELYNATPQRLANPDLKPERLISGEIGLGYRIFQFMNCNVEGYYQRITNLILEVGPLPGGLNQNQNVGDARIFGVEVQCDIRVLNSLEIYWNYTYSWGEYRDLSMPLTSYSPTVGGGNNIPKIAPHKVNAGFTYYILDNLSFHLRINYVSDRTNIGTNPDRSTPGYVLCHGNIRWENAIIHGLFVELMMRNIADTRAWDPGLRAATGGYYPTRHPIEGRNLWLTIGYVF